MEGGSLLFRRPYFPVFHIHVRRRTSPRGRTTLRASTQNAVGKRVGIKEQFSILLLHLVLAQYLCTAGIRKGRIVSAEAAAAAAAAVVRRRFLANSTADLNTNIPPTQKD
ncbi:Hypothetical protein NTJ_03345 [Nesidiocoris tenuis]|uniref:LisH domain-containing protein n=1 Tax=Nesidiocoris tenuis TaxID=355587 RepID=A0ABN7AE26_9HEMI|nr:Hypothetical protein NTJ_03345 [Nesidiocoris tenuis]